jgi:hypothetical protein
VLGGAALHEAMHNKIDQAKGALFGRFDLHAKGGGVASKSLKKQSTGVGLMTKNPTFKIIANSTNRTLWNAHMGKAVKQDLRGTDFEREIFLFR